MSRSAQDALDVADWRRAVAAIYSQVRSEPDPQLAHAGWRASRDELFAEHAQTPLLAEDPLRRTGLPYWPYDPALRFELPIEPALDPRDQALVIQTPGDGDIHLDLIGEVRIPDPIGASLAVWWLHQYGGGIFVPFRDATSRAAPGDRSYGAGRYLLDTAKGADLGRVGGDRVILDFNFSYHPSCRYNPAWVCPLAPAGNVLAVPVRAGERME